MKPYTICKKSIPIVLAIFSALAFTSCQKDNPHSFRDKGGKSGNDLVFVAGYESDGVNSVAKCWINDQALTLPAETNGASANSIFVAGTDAYISGNDGGPVYWKNNIEKSLPVKAGAIANAIYVSGGHVYVAGQEVTGAVYWKDGIEIILNTTNLYGDFSQSTANSIFVSGNDVYVAGKHGPNAVYWKNGIEIYLTNLDKDLSLFMDEGANAIDVSGSDVYVVGYEYVLGAFSTSIKYWKNGIGQGLDHSNFQYATGTNSIFVSGNNVYISGNGFNSPLTPSPSNSALYWKNDNKTVLASHNINSFTSDIYAKGNDVFVSGYELDDNSKKTYAMYWKNGTEVKLTDGTRNAAANSIFVK